MKILHIITSLFTGGAEKLMVDLLPRLRDAGHEVDILVFDGTATPFRENLERSGIRILDCGAGTSVYNPKNIVKIRKLINYYNVIHTHNSSPQFFSAIASLGKNVKMVTTEHNTNNRRRHWPGFSVIDRWMYGRYDSIICISDKAEANLRKFLRKDNKSICTIYNGIDTRKFKHASSSNLLNTYIPNGGKSIIMVAAFRPQKNHATIIEAMEFLPDKFHLFLVGVGEKKADCEGLANSSTASSRIHFLDRRSDIAELLKASDYVVLSSHYEGLSLSSIEGMSVGRPFLASDVDGLHEVVKDAGILFPDGDAKTIAEEILRLDSDPELYSNVAMKCGERASKYDISNMSQAYLEIYESLVQK